MATTMRGSSFGAPNVMQLMQSSDTSTGTPDSLVAMLASCNSMGLQVGPAQHSVGGLEEAVVGCGGQKRGFMYPNSYVDGSVVMAGDDVAMADDDGVDDCSPSVEKKRRLTFDQVRSLERNFELENKLEPERKIQLAKELGLQPRQVAVWFQNRRARWKTKQLERDYEVLSLDYNRMKAEYDSIVLEKEKLETEIQELSGKSSCGAATQEFRGVPGTASTTAAADQAPAAADADTSAAAVSGSVKTTKASPNHVAASVSVKAEILQTSSDELLQQQVLTSCELPAAAQWSKLHHQSSPTGLDNCSKPGGLKESKGQTTSSGSNSGSEILDTVDSPRAIDNYRLSLCNQLVTEQQQVSNCPQFVGDNCFGDPSSLLHVPDDLCCATTAAASTARLCSPAFPREFPRVAIKLEDATCSSSSYQDDQSCNYFLSQMDDKGAMPWWDWA